jgi:ATP-dependent DNA ligase
MKWLVSPAAAEPGIEPLMPVPRAEPFDDPDYLFEPKYDGCRGLLYLRGSAAWFQSKRGEVLTSFDALAERIRRDLPGGSLILDGEIVALDGEGRQDRSALLAGRGQLHYVAFDVLWRGGKDLRAEPLWSRRRTLERLIPEALAVLSPSYAVPERGRALYRAASRLKLEGIVAKRLADPYRDGTVWYAILNRSDRRRTPRGTRSH